MTETVAGPYATTVTPSGIEVAYYVEPKRKYEIRSPERPDGSHNYDWREVPSVTTVTKGVLGISALGWWGMKVGVEGVLTMFNQGRMGGAIHEDSVLMAIFPESGVPEIAGVDNVVEQLIKEQLTVNHVKKEAGDRGQGVHDALEAWAQHGIMPDPSLYEGEDEHGYLKGLLMFLEHLGDAVEPVDNEVMVGSLEHGYAGRYDLRVRITKPVSVIHHHTPTRGPQWARLEPGLYLVDLKTAKNVFGEHCEQLEAYEQASIESGHEPTDGRGVLHTSPEGLYKFVRSWGTFEDFEATLRKYERMQDMKNRAPKGYR